jgi:protease secretion system outer membrane protein
MKHLRFIQVTRSTFIILASAFFFSGNTYALDFMQAYEAALLRDPSFQSATKDFEAGLENDPIGRSAVLPKLTANYSKSANRTTLNGQQLINGVPTGAYNYNSNYPSDYAAIQLTQPVFSLEALARLRQGNAQAGFSRSKFQYLKLDLAYRVLQAYTDLLYSMDHLRFQEAEYVAFEEQAKVSDRQYQKGEAPITDMLQAQSSALTAKAKVVEAKNDIENMKRKLEGIIGQPVRLQDIAMLKRHFPLISIEPKNFELWKDIALKSNIELLAMKDQIEIANQEYKKNIAGHFPVVNLIAAATAQTSNTTVTINQTANQSYAGVQINLPIYGGGEIQARSAQAYFNYQKALADYDVAKERIITELRKQYDQMESGQQKIQALSDAQDSAIRLVEAMRKSVKTGERINLDVLTADKTLFNTRRDLSQAKYQYLIAYLRLYQAGGIFDFPDLQKISGYFVQ